ncbi:hypothetical protein [Curtobacterium sp. VKM Ac-1393]|uniref:hypothetical protein n=1 Tax=Curtobacterium sp. VKM Ac-1393 TaxID=2783814 RepID=UPI00188D46FD|nr:hypothetical protein [Curtobacterium sp. VKM Ac-1393]MBF4606564.1 hypothetical protein [Curtobacterium sp. VKM Ac-1393]
MQKFCAIVAGAGLVATLVSAGPGVANAVEEGPPVISGAATRADGAPFSAGASVGVFAVERDDRATSIGSEVRSVPVAAGTVGSGGRFDLRIDDVATVEEFADANGVVDLEVRALDGAEFAPFALSRKLTRSGDALSFADPSVDAERNVKTRDAGSESIAMRATGTAVSSAEVGMQPTSARTSSATPFTQVCGETKTKNLGVRRVLVGATYALASYTNGRFVYKNGASSNLGVVYSANAKKGSWSKAGTVSRSSDAGVDYGNRYGGTAYYTYFTYGQYAQWCRPVGSTKNSVYNHVVRATGYAGGSQVASAPVPTATKCTNFSNNTTITRSSTSSNTWEQAVNFIGPLGVTLTAKTGWSSNAAMSYTNKSGSTKRVCGTKGYWGGTPERAVTK